MSLKSVVAAVALVLSIAALALTVLKPQTPPAGAVVGPDIQGPSYSVNGQVTYKFHQALNRTASTSCAIRAPREGTSTLVYASMKISSSTSAATIFEIGQSPGADATTTLIGTKYGVASDAYATIVASTSPAAGDAIIFAPGAWLNIKQGGVLATGFGGTCNASFIVN